MSLEHRWAVDLATGTFLYGHAEPYDCDPGLSPGQRRVVLDRAPDPHTEYYSGDPAHPFATRSPEQMLAREDAVRFGTERLQREAWAPDAATTFLLEALLARLPQILDELAGTGKVGANQWARLIGSDTRTLHRARRARG